MSVQVKEEHVDVRDAPAPPSAALAQSSVESDFEKYLYSNLNRILRDHSPAEAAAAGAPPAAVAAAPVQKKRSFEDLLDESSTPAEVQFLEQKLKKRKKGIASRADEFYFDQRTDHDDFCNEQVTERCDFIQAQELAYVEYLKEQVARKRRFEEEQAVERRDFEEKLTRRETRVEKLLTRASRRATELALGVCP